MEPGRRTLRPAPPNARAPGGPIPAAAGGDDTAAVAPPPALRVSAARSHRSRQGLHALAAIAKEDTAAPGAPVAGEGKLGALVQPVVAGMSEFNYQNYRYYRAEKLPAPRVGGMAGPVLDPTAPPHSLMLHQRPPPADILAPRAREDTAAPGAPVAGEGKLGDLSGPPDGWQKDAMRPCYAANGRAAGGSAMAAPLPAAPPSRSRRPRPPPPDIHAPGPAEQSAVAAIQTTKAAASDAKAAASDTKAAAGPLDLEVSDRIVDRIAASIADRIADRIADSIADNIADRIADQLQATKSRR